MRALYFRFAWMIFQLLLEATMGTLAAVGLWVTVRPYLYGEPQGLQHPVITSLVLAATFWMAVGPSPWRSRPAENGAHSPSKGDGDA